MPPKFKAYLQLARISNLPTVFSNVLVGAAMAPIVAPLDWTLVFAAMFAVSLFYIGGMALNDLFDQEIDAIERPHRPIPSGALTALEVSLFSSLCNSMGIMILAISAPAAFAPAAILMLSILLYNFLHKRWSGSLFFMGLCRALVYIVAAFSVIQQTIIYDADGTMIEPAMVLGPEGVALLLANHMRLPIAAVLLALYIIALTLVAQKEVSGGLGFRRWLAAALVLIPIPALCFMPVLDWRWTAPAMLLLTLWLIRSARFIWQSPPKVVPAVLGWLAGISLLDAFFLTFSPFPWLSLAALACFAVTVWGHRRIAGT